MRRTAGLALVSMALVTGTAQAAPTAHIDALTFTVAGCQATGALAGISPAAGTLGAGTYTYYVSAVTAAGEVSPICSRTSQKLAGTPGQTSILLQWNRTPGATAYRIYRALGSGTAAALE